MNTTIQTQAGGLVRRAAEEYVGGKSVLLRLEVEFPELVKPFYETAKFKVYRRESLDAAIAAAHMQDRPLNAMERKAKP